MKRDRIEPLPRVPDADLEEHGIRIPAATPRLGSIPNPWKPQQSQAGKEDQPSTNGSATPKETPKTS